MSNKKKVLVLCTGNSCRSIMAEALINHFYGDTHRAFSAGSKPEGYVHPKSIETLRRHGIDMPNPVSQSWDEYVDVALDVVITVCDRAANEECPLFPGNWTKLHWSTPDPARAPEASIEQAFEEVYEQLKRRIDAEFAT